MSGDPYAEAEVEQEAPALEVDVPPPPMEGEVVSPAAPPAQQAVAMEPVLLGTDPEGQPVYGYPAPRPQRFPGLGRFLLACGVGVGATLLLQAAGASRRRDRDD